LQLNYQLLHYLFAILQTYRNLAMSLAWDDLRVVLAVARAGSLAEAARALGVNHSTVFRRLNTFEEQLGVRLFERLANGYALTIAGEEMRASAERVEQEIDRLDRRITGQDLRLQGTLAITTTDTLASCVLAPHLVAFKRAHPAIELNLLLENQYVNLSKRQADIAIRPTLSPPDTLVGRRIAAIAFAPFVSAHLLTDKPNPHLGDLDWIAVDESLAHLAADKWFRATLPGANVVMRSNSLTGLMAAAVSGMGVAMLPCFIGDPSPVLTRLADPVDAAASALWLLTHEDLHHTARVRAFMDFMADALKEDVALLEGRLCPFPPEEG